MALFSPRWSPNGRYVVAMTLNSLQLMLFDFTTQKWTDLADMFAAFPNWSRDGDYVYFNGAQDNDPGYFRIRISDRKLERILSPKGFPDGAMEPSDNGAASPRTDLRCLSATPASRKSTPSTGKRPDPAHKLTPWCGVPRNI